MMRRVQIMKFFIIKCLYFSAQDSSVLLSALSYRGAVLFPKIDVPGTCSVSKFDVLIHCGMNSW
jgi:hypothetical protein